VPPDGKTRQDIGTQDKVHSNNLRVDKFFGPRMMLSIRRDWSSFLVFVSWLVPVPVADSLFICIFVPVVCVTVSLCQFPSVCRGEGVNCVGVNCWRGRKEGRGWDYFRMGLFSSCQNRRTGGIVFVLSKSMDWILYGSKPLYPLPQSQFPNTWDPDLTYLFPL
jgi:hypothetical protein